MACWWSVAVVRRAVLVLLLTKASFATNCWTSKITLHYSVGPSVVSLSDSEAIKIMKEIETEGAALLRSCPGLTLKLGKVSIGTSNVYAITGTFAVNYGNMNANQKRTALTCITNNPIFRDVIIDPDRYTSPIGGQHRPTSASPTNYADELCCADGSVKRNARCELCQAGTYHVVHNATCTSCHNNTYQPTAGQILCLPCVNGSVPDGPNPVRCIFVMANRTMTSQAATPGTSLLVQEILTQILLPASATSLLPGTTSTLLINTTTTSTPISTQHYITTTLGTIPTLLISTTTTSTPIPTQPNVTKTPLPTSATSLLPGTTSTLLINITTTSTPTPTSPPPTYPILKCYTMDFNAYYAIPGGATLSELEVLAQIEPLFKTFGSSMDSLIPVCSSVKATIRQVFVSGPGITPAKITVRVKFTATGSIDDLTACLNELSDPKYEPLFSRIVPSVEEKGVIYVKHNVTITNTISCCGSNSLPPCCLGNDVQISPTYCGRLRVFRLSHLSQTVPLGGQLIIHCEVQVFFPPETLEVYWERNGNRIQQLTVDRTHRVGVYKNHSLLFTDAKTSDAGMYACAVTNGYQVIKKMFTLSVSVSKQVKMSLTLSVQFHSDLLNKSSTRYQAFADGFKAQGRQVFSHLTGLDKIEVTAIRNGSVVVDFMVYMTRVLKLPQAEPPDIESQLNIAIIQQVLEGQFGNFSVRSDGLSLNVPPPPPNDIRAVGRSTDFIKLQWRPPQGAQFYHIADYVIRYNGLRLVTTAETEKTIMGLKPKTKYDFRITSRNFYGEGKSRVKSVTTLSEKPVILNDGQNFNVTVGGSVNLTCKASSKPPPAITWTRNDVTLAAVSSTDDQQAVTSRLLLENVQSLDSGEYKCTARNGDSSTTGRVTLIVNVPIQVEMKVTLAEETFTIDLKNESSPKYKKLEMKIVLEVSKIYENVTGFIRVEVLGFNNGSVDVQFRVIFIIKVKEPNNTKDDPDRFKIKVANRIIIVVNVTGKIGDLKVIPESLVPTNVKPPQPRNLRVTETEKTWVHIEWIAPLFAERYKVTHYHLRVREFNRPGRHKDPITVQYGNTDRRVDKLQPGTSYTVTVAAKSRTLLGLESRVEFTTEKGVIPMLDLLSLWVSLGVIVPVLLIIFFVWYRKRRHNNRYVANSSSKATNKVLPRDRNINIFSFKNEAFAVPNLEGLGLTGMWEIPRNCLKLGDKLGSGEFGYVSKGNLQTDERVIPCAVKMLKQMASEEEYCDLFDELKIMINVGSHSNIVNLIGACTVDGPLLVVIELAKGGCLLDYLRAHTAPMYADTEMACALDETEKLQIARDVAHGMNHLAYMKCVHRDLAARNVLLMSDGTAKVSDFGLARDVYERGLYEKLTEGRLPVRWMALEAIEMMMFTTQSDIWSYGVLLWEIEAGGKKPYGALVMRELLPQLKRGIRLKRPPGCEQDIYNLMLRCWDANPDNRPSFEKIHDILEESYLSNLLDIPESLGPARQERQPHGHLIKEM